LRTKPWLELELLMVEVLKAMAISCI
jgi:hypothetical protein